MAGPPLSPTPVQNPIAGDNKLVSPAWAAWFQQLFQALQPVASPTVVAARRTGSWQIAGVSDTLFKPEALPTLASMAGTPNSQPGTADPAYEMIRYQSGAVSGNVAGVQGIVAVTSAAYLPRLTTVFRTDAVNTSQRVYVGLVASDTSGLATLAALNTIRCAVIRFDTGLGDTKWQCITSDGTTASAVSSGVAFAVNQTLTLVVDLSTPGHAKFTINGNPATPTIDKVSNIPTGNTFLGPQASITTLTTAVRNIYLSSFRLEQN